MCFFPLLQVIYALNTKNDEHEAAIATLKEAHEEEVQQILSETREKILQVCVCVCLTLNLLGSLELCTSRHGPIFLLYRTDFLLAALPN